MDKIVIVLTDDMITCQDILELQLDGVELIAGEEGLTRPVTWTYMV